MILEETNNDAAVQRTRHKYTELNYGSSCRSHARSSRSTYTTSSLLECWRNEPKRETSAPENGR